MNGEDEDKQDLVDDLIDLGDDDDDLEDDVASVLGS